MLCSHYLPYCVKDVLFSGAWKQAYFAMQLTMFRAVFFSVPRYMVSKMSSKMAGSNNLINARRTVQQLRVEASIERIKVQYSPSFI